MRLDHMIEPQDVGFVALGVLVGAIAVVSLQAGSETDVRARSPAFSAGPICPASATDPIAEELARCRDLPPEKADDAYCRKLWAAQRRKFLAPRKPSEMDEQPLDLFPSVPKAPEPGAGPRARAQKSE